MNIDAFLTSRQRDWEELSLLMRESRGKLSRLNPASIVRFSSLYRSTCADLAFARREYAGDAVQYNLESIVSTCSSMLYEHRAADRSRIWYFVTTGALASIAQRPKLLLVSFLLMMVPWIVSSVYAQYNPENALGLAPAGVESVVERPSADFELTPAQKAEVSAQILTNNIRIAFMAFAAGITVILTMALLFYQGIALGTTFGLTVEAGNADVLWQFVFPHGFLEISCIIVAGAAGLRLGMAVLNPGFRRRSDALRQEGRQALASICVVGATLFFCGIVEGVVSTSGISPEMGLALGITLCVVFWVLIVTAHLRDRNSRSAQRYSEDLADTLV
jgi:uncharacterized membrane protein SpoIIM required for sporulation